MTISRGMPERKSRWCLAGTGVDISAHIIEELKRRLGPVQHLPCLIRGVATMPPFRDTSIGVALAAHVLRIVVDWCRALSQIGRLARPSGFYQFCEQGWNESSPRLVFRRRWDDIFPRHYEADPVPPDARRTDVLPALREKQAELNTVIGASWREVLPITERLNPYANRAFSSQWHFSEDVLEAVVRKIRAWVTQQDPSEERLLADEHTLEPPWRAAGSMKTDELHIVEAGTPDAKCDMLGVRNVWSISNGAVFRSSICRNFSSQKGGPILDQTKTHTSLIAAI